MRPTLAGCQAILGEARRQGRRNGRVPVEDEMWIGLAKLTGDGVDWMLDQS